MTLIQETPLNDWKAFVEIADRVDIGDSFKFTYIFRGQEDAGWILEPSIQRAATNDGRIGLPEINKLLYIEKNLTEKFRSVAPNHIPSASLSASTAVIDWWPLMRHYGVPTRIFDWTASIYVAAYFATAKRVFLK